ncbi:MAG: hypothetical protein R3F59_00715 [Myxococcota bacterium]
MRRTPLALLVPLAGCLGSVHRPVCEEVAATEVADDEVTPAGTAAELLQRVTFDGELPATWADGAATTAAVAVTRGEGPAAWVELRSSEEVTRRVGFGALYLLVAVTCDDHLRVPTKAFVATDDGALEVSAAGEATVVPDQPSGRLVFEGAFAEAVLPPGDRDPADYEGRASFVEASYDELGLLEGAAGWTGERTTADYQEAVAERVITFARE